MNSGQPPIRVVVFDADSGEQLGEQVVRDDYVLLCHGTCHVEHIQTHSTGTHVLTVKGRKEAAP